MRVWSLKWRFSLLSFTVFRTFYIHGHTTAFGFTWYDCQWPWPYFMVIRLFHFKFLINGVWYGESYYRLLIGNHTVAYEWCHFWWPWSTFEGHFSLRCHFHVHFSNLSQAFASKVVTSSRDFYLGLSYALVSYVYCIIFLFALVRMCDTNIMTDIGYCILISTFMLSIASLYSE